MTVNEYTELNSVVFISYLNLFFSVLGQTIVEKKKKLTNDFGFQTPQFS